MEPEKPKPVEEKKVEPTEVEKKLPAPATAEAVQATAAEPVQAKLMQPAAAVEPACPNKGIQGDPPQQQGGLTRRAAANVLSRVKDSESRLKSEFPSWMHSHIMNPANKSELITLIKESGGELKAVQAKLEITLKEEMVKSNMAKSSMIPLTEVEIIGKYGEAEAAKVMQQKVKDRLTVPDPNRSGGLLYLMQQDTTEYKRQQTDLGHVWADGSCQCGPFRPRGLHVWIQRGSLQDRGRSARTTGDTAQKSRASYYLAVAVAKSGNACSTCSAFKSTACGPRCNRKGCAECTSCSCYP